MDNLATIAATELICGSGGDNNKCKVVKDAVSGTENSDDHDYADG